MSRGEKGRRRKGRSASGEVDGPLKPPEATIFEEVEEEPQDIPEFEPVEVEWEGGEEGETEPPLPIERFEALLEELFSDTGDNDDLGFFEEVRDTLVWSEGEVIWEGMDFDQLFPAADDFAAFEALSLKDQRAYIRDRLRTQQASGTAEASDGETELQPLPTPARQGQAGAKAPETDRSSGPLVSYETETEHQPQDLDISIGVEKRRKHRRR